MKASNKGIAAIVIHEGIVPGPYLDSKRVWTYGVGHTAAAGAPDPEDMPRGVPYMPDDRDAGVKAALELFRKDLAKYEADVNAALVRPVTQHQFDALVSFHYNTGAIHRAKVTEHVNSGDLEAATTAFMGWTKPKEIIPRRRAEQYLFSSGVYPAGDATVWAVDTAGKVQWGGGVRIPSDKLLQMLGREPKARPALKVIAATVAASASAGVVANDWQAGVAVAAVAVVVAVGFAIMRKVKS